MIKEELQEIEKVSMEGLIQLACADNIADCKSLQNILNKISNILKHINE